MSVRKRKEIYTLLKRNFLQHVKAKLIFKS